MQLNVVTFIVVGYEQSPLAGKVAVRLKNEYTEPVLHLDPVEYSFKLGDRVDVWDDADDSLPKPHLALSINGGPPVWIAWDTPGGWQMVRRPDGMPPSRMPRPTTP